MRELWCGVDDPGEPRARVGPTCAQVVTETAKEARLREERRHTEAYLAEKKRPRTTRRPRPTSGSAGLRTDLSRRRSAPRTGRKPKGTTNAQVKELARLPKAAGEPYGGRGLTEREARVEID